MGDHGAEGLNLRNLDQVKRYAASAGNHFFSRGAMRFFDSRVAKTIYPVNGGAGVFVTSERNEDDPRFWSVRLYYVDAEGRFNIERLTPFDSCHDPAAAKGEARRVASILRSGGAVRSEYYSFTARDGGGLDDEWTPSGGVSES